MIKFYEHSLNKVRAKKADYIMVLAEGQAHTFDYYRFLCGKINAYSEMEALLKELFDQMQHNKNPQNETKNAQLY